MGVVLSLPGAQMESDDLLNQRYRENRLLRTRLDDLRANAWDHGVDVFAGFARRWSAAFP